MNSELVQIITSTDSNLRDSSLDPWCESASFDRLMQECQALHQFQKQSQNLYERVRALFFLYAIHRFHLPKKLAKNGSTGLIPFDGYQELLERRFEQAIEKFLKVQDESGPSDALSSALSDAYKRLGFQTLAEQVKLSVRSAPGNRWMFEVARPEDYKYRVKPELLAGERCTLHEQVPVRMDLSHSAWSDIFFLGMDYPQGAKVINISIDLAVQGRHETPMPPIHAYFRVIDRPVIRLVSVDLDTWSEIKSLGEVFDLAKDYLGLLKAALIASGIVPPSLEKLDDLNSEVNFRNLLRKLVGNDRGIELISAVNDIPKGSRLAVSTNLLAALIAVCMRATGQTGSLTGPLTEEERRMVAARAILGEWLGGSGGGWQDSGGVWPGVKLIHGVVANEGDIEHGTSKGCLLPKHELINSPLVRSNESITASDRASPASPSANGTTSESVSLQDCLVLVHGGMAQNVGPILEMVTEKYLLRSPKEWNSRQTALQIFDEILQVLRNGPAESATIKKLGSCTSRNFFEPIQTIIPWANNLYTETLNQRIRAKFGDDFWGFWMLGGMSGGGMGFIFNPARKAEALESLGVIMQTTKDELKSALPFAMDPVVYDFRVNPNGATAELISGAADQPLPEKYYAMLAPFLLRKSPDEMSKGDLFDLQTLGEKRRDWPVTTQAIIARMLPFAWQEKSGGVQLKQLLEQYGFDPKQHERIRDDMKHGRIGLAKNRLPANTLIEDVAPQDVVQAAALERKYREFGQKAIERGEIAVVTLAAGVGSRWTQGAGVAKALHPFCRLGGKYRSFLEVQFAKTARIAEQAGVVLPQVVTTSYMTNAPIAQYIEQVRPALSKGSGKGRVEPMISFGQAVGLRMIPMVRDLDFQWNEMPRQLLDEQAQKVLESLQKSLAGWAKKTGEATDYTDNKPEQCLHPVGHWYEVPSMLANGTLRKMLEAQPQLKYLMLHNIDTLGVNLDPAIVGYHMAEQSCLTFEVISRRVDDRGGGLADVDGRVRLVEGLAMPREEDEFKLSYYNTMTTWIDIDRLLTIFGLNRQSLFDPAKVTAAIRKLADRMPTYITLKDVKKRWGNGQEDIYPVAQFEKLWSDMTGLSDVACRFVVVPRMRGQQLKDQAQLDGWYRDGSAAYVEQLCGW